MMEGEVPRPNGSILRRAKPHLTFHLLPAAFSIMTAAALHEFKHRIESLTAAERLELMEVLWDGISHNESGYASPEWHHEALQASEQAVEEGRATFTDWPEAEAELRRKLGLKP